MSKPTYDTKVVERAEDMSPLGLLRLYLQTDGDVIVEVVSFFGPSGSHEFRDASVEFCTHAGGGHSPKTLAALRQLYDAIQEEEEPQDIRGRLPEGYEATYPNLTQERQIEKLTEERDAWKSLAEFNGGTAELAELTEQVRAKYLSDD